MRRLLALVAATYALDCESEDSPFAESRFIDDKGTTCPPGKYLCGDTSEHAYCFGDYKTNAADWKHASHYPFEWVADEDDSEVNTDGNCIFCTSPDATPELDDMDARMGIVEQEAQSEERTGSSVQEREERTTPNANQKRKVPEQNEKVGQDRKNQNTEKEKAMEKSEKAKGEREKSKEEREKGEPDIAKAESLTKKEIPDANEQTANEEETRNKTVTQKQAQTPTDSTASKAAQEAPQQGEHEGAERKRRGSKEAKKSFYITNDPFFVVDGKKGHFWLNAGMPTKLLSAPFPDASHSVALIGETFGDGEASQWFKTYTIAVNGDHLVKVEVADKPEEGLMRTMKIWTNGHHLTAPRNAVHHVGYNVTVKADALPIKKIGTESAEEVIIRTPAASFTIWTQQANKFDEWEKRVQYAHLNMEVEGGLPRNSEGVAAEFAGVRPMSADTQKLLQMPYPIAQERKEAKHMRKWIAKNKRRISDMKQVAMLDADANDNDPTPQRRTRRQRRHEKRMQRSENKRLMKSWERKLTAHARKESMREERHLNPA